MGLDYILSNSYKAAHHHLVSERVPNKKDFAADFPILILVTVPEAINLAMHKVSFMHLVDEALRTFPQFDDVARLNQSD